MQSVEDLNNFCKSQGITIAPAKEHKDGSITFHLIFGSNDTHFHYIPEFGFMLGQIQMICEVLEHYEASGLIAAMD